MRSLYKSLSVLMILLASVAAPAQNAQGGAQGNHVSKYQATKFLFDANSIYAKGQGPDYMGWILKYPRNGINVDPQEIKWVADMLAIDGGFIYYLSTKPQYSDSDPQALMKIPKTGGKSSVVISGDTLKGGEIIGLAFDANNIYASVDDSHSSSRILQVDRQTLKVTVLTKQPEGRLQLALVKGQLFWGDDDGSVKMIDLSNTSQVHVVTSHKETFSDLGFISDGQNLFWSNRWGYIKKYSPGSHTITTLAKFDCNMDAYYCGRDLSTDGKDLYWLNETHIYRVPVSGGEPQMVDVGAWTIYAMGIDAKSIYYSIDCQKSETTGSWTTYQTDTWQQQYVGRDGYIYNGTRSNTYPVTQTESKCVLEGGVFRIPKN